MCFDASTSSISGPAQTCFDSTNTLPTLAAPPQFADSPPDEVSFRNYIFVVATNVTDKKEF